MGFLSKTAVDIPNFNKAVISFWFRVPQASIDACIAATTPDDPPSPPPPFYGVIPLVNFGEVFEDAYIVRQLAASDDAPYTFKQWSPGSALNDWTPILISTTPDNGGGHFEFVSSDPYTLPGSYIGVDVTGDTPLLTVRLQTAEHPTITGLSMQQTAITIGELNTVTEPGGTPTGSNFDAHVSPDNPAATVYTLHGKDWITSETWSDVSEFANSLTEPESFGGTSLIEITADTWHHVLLSFDLSKPVSVTGGDALTITSECKLWCAVDDVNYLGVDLPGTYYFADPPPDFDDHTVIPDRAFRVYTATPNENFSIATPSFISSGWTYHINTMTGRDAPLSYDFPASLLSTADKPFGIPAHPPFADNIYKVAMAEFQMYAGVTIDTGVEASRRAFIDADGKPVPSKLSRNEDGDLEAAEDSPPFLLLEQLPAVAFVKSASNWIGGKDFGLAADTLDKTGTIKTFKPDPKLGPDTPP